MTLAERWARHMQELQRARQRKIDHALRNGSRPGLDDNGRVILVPRGGQRDSDQSDR